MLWIERLVEVYGDSELLMRTVAAADGWRSGEKRVF